MADNLVNDVLLDLKKSFLEEKSDIQNRVVEIETEIRECNEFIDSLNKKDDCDYNLFSPRSTSRIYKDQVYEKKLRIEELEEELKSVYKRLSFVTKKVDSLNTLKSDQISLNDNSYNNDKSKMMFLRLQEDDRQRIAADLHDSVLQNLTLLMHNLELAGRYIDVDPVHAKLELETNRKLIKSTIEDIRSTIFDLRPMQFDDFGFKKTIENHLESYKSRTSINIEYKIDYVDELDNIILLTLFRVIQELVNNSIKHSKANTILVQILDEGNKVYLEVSDDGIGVSGDFLNKENHFGLKILKERVNMVSGSIYYPQVDVGFKTVIEIPY
ncbi:MAG: sensor histidine kinase [Firmicutes bacterium]|nr:sensor histidine kinase [Candidatus Colivicinus equi]